ncbi:ion transport protein-like protein [Leptomonas pyrrhocoris]|uniref:Ion transport protein-like protein n=1 Tax=Leptomonas pyrrhocoris TaxID=157538 RepID=A0A0N0VE20_LEPPY|nr:ion transport protein-like protein [Leptomonas pyrrhocoris]KPA77221.1 ion transport protein-like protein [Leptomonas pyrrhocoris]|eukprot:XP_015655660.1 ion transport protein-like protein [Leptomonas pyrrhocoris]
MSSAANRPTNVDREMSALSPAPPTTSAAAASSEPTSIIPANSNHVKKRPRGALNKVARTITKGPRLLGRRIKHFLKDDLYIDVRYQKAPPKVVTKELAVLEVLSVYHRWLRGVQALLSIAVFILSLLSVPNSAVIVNCTIFVVSQAACLVICKTYHVKAQFSGVTNVLFEGRNIFTSPYFPNMVAELILWNIQTPPWMFWGQPFFNLLDYFIFLRMYSIVVYLNNAAYVYRTFCRTMSAISDLPLSTSFMIRTGLLYHKVHICATVIVCTWLSIGCLYARAESVNLGDALWFSFQSLATLGYGDITPSTLSGRAVAFVAWLASYFLMAYLITILYSLLRASEQSQNMQTLMECHDLAHSLRSRSARVIQIAWKLHRVRTASLDPSPWKEKARTLLLSWLLTHMIAALRRTRQSFSDAQRSLQETTVHPLTGLSAFQYNAFLLTTHRAARHLQRVKDVDRVYLALRDRDVPASSLSRRDIESIIILPGDSLEADAASSFAAFGGGGGGGGGARAESATVIAEVAQWKDRVSQLEQKCVRLSEVLDRMSAVAETHPPSMAVSQL